MLRGPRKNESTRYRRESVTREAYSTSGRYDPASWLSDPSRFTGFVRGSVRPAESMCLRDTLSTDMKRYSRIVFRVIEMALEWSRCLDMNEGLSRVRLYLACSSFLICWRFSRWHVSAPFKSSSMIFASLRIELFIQDRVRSMRVKFPLNFSRL